MLAMTAANPAKSTASFEIKSASLPLVALLLRSPDLVALAHGMAQRFGDIPDFFEKDPLVIDLSPLNNSADAGAAIDFTALLHLLRQYRLAPIAFKGASTAHAAAAQAAGLVCARDALLVHPKVQAVPCAEAPGQQPPAFAALQASAVNAALGALVIDKPLRSGQQVYARGRDLVVLAMVNAGAEVIADGSIHVYAPLRGKAIAGARGNLEARIFSLALDAELLSIAGVYRTSDTPLPAGIQGKPCQVRLVTAGEGDKLVMDALSG